MGDISGLKLSEASTPLLTRLPTFVVILLVRFVPAGTSIVLSRSRWSVIILNRTADPVFQQAEIETNVIGGCLLPFKVSVVTFGTEFVTKVLPNWYLALSCPKVYLAR